MKIRDILKNAVAELSSSGIENPKTDVWIIFSDVFGLTYPEIIMRQDDEADLIFQNKFFEMIEKRKEHIPVQYILGYAELFVRKFIVNPNVLIPRPETEILIEAVLSEISKSEIKNLKIADIGTGSGCIALTIALESPGIQMIATDISEKALTVARQNAKNLAVKNVKFREGDLLSDFPEKVNIIIANLPYIREDAMPGLQDEVRHEPEMALVAGDDGLELIDRLLSDVYKYLIPGGSVFLEADPAQMEKIKDLANEYFQDPKIEIIKDMIGLDRVIKIQI